MWACLIGVAFHNATIQSAFQGGELGSEVLSRALATARGVAKCTPHLHDVLAWAMRARGPSP